jgi:hypothetical protein
MLRAFEIYCESCGINEEWDDHIPGINESYTCSSCGELGRRVFSSPALNGLTSGFLDVADHEGRFKTAKELDRYAESRGGYVLSPGDSSKVARAERATERANKYTNRLFGKDLDSYRASVLAKRA